MKLLKTIILIAILSLPLTAQWSPDSTVNTPVSVGSEDQNSIASANSSDNGLLISWQDGRDGGNNSSDIYAQKIDRSGNTLWSTNGVVISSAVASQQNPAMIADNEGGAIIAWEDSRVFNNIDIYAQRVDGAGNVLWTIDGVGICLASGVQRNPAMVPDGEGGAIITWQDFRAGGSEVDIYAQRVDSNGVVQWATDGLPVSTFSGRQQIPRIVPDGSGGAIIVWEDMRVSGSSDIYAQRMDPSGAPLWATNGIPVCNATNFQEAHEIAGDDAGGAIITWVDFRNDATLSNSDIYAQKVAADGNVAWEDNGIAVCTNTATQNSPVIVRDDNGGAIIAWDDDRTQDLNLFMQRIDNQGATLWVADGIQLTNQSGSQDESSITPDGAGGAIIAWEDRRNNNFDIYAQRVGPTGNLHWGASGVAISIPSGSQRYIRAISDQHGGAYISWEDRRTSGNGDDVYAQQINASGDLGVTITGLEESARIPEEFTLRQNYPNPFNASTVIEFSLQSGKFTTLKIYNLLGGSVATLVAEFLPSGVYRFNWHAGELASGVYHYRLTVGDHVQTRKMLLVR